MSKLMEQAKAAGQDIDKSLHNIDKDYEPIDKIQEPEKEDKNEKDVKNNFSEFIEFSDPKDFEIQNFGAGTTVIKGAKTVGGKIAKITRKIDPDINDTVNIIVNDMKTTMPKVTNSINDKALRTYVGLKYAPKASTKEFVKEYIPKVAKNTSDYTKDKVQKIYKLFTDSKYRKNKLTFDNINNKIQKVAPKLMIPGYLAPGPGTADIAGTITFGSIYGGKKAKKAAEAIKYGYDIRRNAVRSAFAKDIAQYSFDESKKDDIIKATVVGGVVGGTSSTLSDATKGIWKIIYMNGKKILVKIK